jgi:hypothetical protein
MLILDWKLPQGVRCKTEQEAEEEVDGDVNILSFY